MATTALSVAEICAAAKHASRELAVCSSALKNTALDAIATALLERGEEILEANARDLETGEQAGLSAALIDRLRLDTGRLAAIAAGARQIAALPDPVGEVIDGFRHRSPRTPKRKSCGSNRPARGVSTRICFGAPRSRSNRNTD